MNQCAICGFRVSKDLCNRCYKTYCIDENGELIELTEEEKGWNKAERKKNKISILKKLDGYEHTKWIANAIRAEKSRRYTESIELAETFSDYGLDIDGELLTDSE